MTDNTEGLRKAREERSLKKRRAVEQALAELQASGEKITFKAVSIRASVSRQYLYNNFKSCISAERSQSAASSERIDGVTVPKRTVDEYKHIEALLRNKIDRLKKDLGDVRKENARLKIALERERGKSEHFRKNWISASARTS